jgi:hypothetical protein
MSTKKLWAAALTGLLGCVALSQAADPVAPGTLVPMPPGAQTRTIVPSPYGVVKPAETKWSEAKVQTSDKPAPLTPDTKPAQPSDLKPVAPPGSVLLPGGEGGAPGCSSCGGCATTCEACGAGHRLCSGKLRGWLSYHPPRTPLGECAGDYRIPDIYTFFLDVPCRTSWKPVECERLCGHCGHCGQGSPYYLTVFAPAPAPVPPPAPELAPAPEPLPAPKPAPARGFATDR